MKSTLSQLNGDEALARAAELLASQGRRRDAIALVERALRERTTDDSVLLLALLLFGTGAPGDRRLAKTYLSKLQWRTAEVYRRFQKFD